MAKSILSFEEFAAQTKETKEIENVDALEESCEVCDADPCVCETTGQEDEVEDEEIEDEDDDSEITLMTKEEEDDSEIIDEMNKEVDEIEDDIEVEGLEVEVASAKEDDQELSEEEVDSKRKEYGDYDPTLDLSSYALPPIDLLKDYGSALGNVDKAELEANKNKEGVLTTESGLLYIVVKEGSNNKPSATDNVTVHYHGTTPEGVVFDSSVDRGEPSSFGLNQVIKGWTEGLQLMGEGAKFKFFIPQELAYGANPRGGVIKPFMPLVFDVELIKINK